MPLSLYTARPVTAELLPRLLSALERPQIRSKIFKNRVSSVRSTAAAARFVSISTCRKSVCESRLAEGATRIVGGTRSADTLDASARVPRAAKHGHPLLAHGRGHLLSSPRAYFSTSDAPKQPVDEEEEKETQPCAPTSSSSASDSDSAFENLAVEYRELLGNAFINPNTLTIQDPERKVIRKYFKSVSRPLRKLSELRALGSIRVSVTRPRVIGSDNPDTSVGRHQEVYEWVPPTPSWLRTRTGYWEMHLYNEAIAELKSLGFRVSASQSCSSGGADMEENGDAHESVINRLRETLKARNVPSEERINTDADTKTNVLEEEGRPESHDIVGRVQAHLDSIQDSKPSRQTNAEGGLIAGQEERRPSADTDADSVNLSQKDQTATDGKAAWEMIEQMSQEALPFRVNDRSSASSQEEPTQVKDSTAQKRAFALPNLVKDVRTSERMDRAEAEKKLLNRLSQTSSPGPTIRSIDDIFSSAKKSHQSTLPPYEYGEADEDIQVVYVRDQQRANYELERIFYPAYENRLSRIVGFDIEWRPSWRDELSENAVSLVQLARGKRILLLQISAMRTFPKKLIEFLDDETFIKAGVDILSDAQRLYRDYAVITRSCVELSYLARAVDRSRWPGDMRQLISLARLVQAYRGRLLPKGSVRMSNWEDELTESQQRYAANDAHAGLQVATALLKRGNHIDRSLFMFDVVRAHAVQADGQFCRVRTQSGFPPLTATAEKSEPPPADPDVDPDTDSPEPRTRPFLFPRPKYVNRLGEKRNAADLVKMIAEFRLRDARKVI